MKRAVLALVILLLTAIGASGAESMKTAINIVEDFTREANILMASRSLAPLSSAAKENAVNELKQIRLTETPGQERSEKVYVVVSSYTGYVVDAVRRADGRTPDIAEIAGRLEDLRADMLKKLKGALDSESVRKREPKPVPSLDLSPHDEPPTPDNEKSGILFR